MHSLLVVIVVSSLAFIATMIDNFFAFGAQLIVTDPSRQQRVSSAQAMGVGALVLIAGVISVLLEPIPVRWVGLLAIAPFAFAFYAWNHRSAPREQFRRGGVTTFLITLALGGDNLSVWIPLFRANHGWHDGVVVVMFALWECVFLVSARSIAHRPRVVQWGRDHASSYTPFLYVFLGALVLVECHTF